MMPEASVPRPSAGSEASLGWAPVHPSSVVEGPSVPDLLGTVPFPDDLRGLLLLTVVADSLMARMFPHESETFSLGAQDVPVLGIDLFPALAVSTLGGASDVSLDSDVLLIIKLTVVEKLLVKEINVVVLHVVKQGGLINFLFGVEALLWDGNIILGFSLDVDCCGSPK